MIVLAADTSGRQGSIALARCGPALGCEVLQVVELQGGTFSAQLVPQVARLLAEHRLDKSAIDGFAIASGPGSFTGLRVGLAAIKALAEIMHKPIAAVSLLEAAAVASAAPRVVAALDAGRNEVYVGEYGGGRLVSERLLPLSQFLVVAVGLPVVTPDSSVAAAARSAGLDVEEIQRPSSGDIARLGWRKLHAGETISSEQLEANYIRRSDAEIFSQAR